MKWQTTHTNRLSFIIEHDKSVGYYLYSRIEQLNVRDDLQDTLDIVMDIARSYGVSDTLWHQEADVLQAEMPAPVTFTYTIAKNRLGRFELSIQKKRYACLSQQPRGKIC